MNNYFKKYIFIFLLLPLCSFAQKDIEELTKWEAKPKLHTPTAIEAKEPAFWVLSHITEFYSYNSEGIPSLNSVVHKIVHINESKSIEDYNKIYIPVEDETDLEFFQARTITPSGKIIEIKKSDLKLVSEDGEKYLTIALEGMEVGSEMEYVCSLKKEISFIGTQYVQSSVFYREMKFALVTPDNLIMKSKVYNSNVTSVDTVIDEVRSITYTFKDVLPQLEEKYSGEDANLIRVEYKLDKNKARGTSNINSYGEVGKNYYGSITNLDKNDQKELTKLLDKIKVAGKTDEEKVRMIEAYLKTNFRLDKQAQFENLATCIKTAIVNEYSCNKLFINLIRTAQIKYEIVATISRFKKKFDSDFESSSFLKNILVYFPTLDKYVTPNDYSARLGVAGYVYSGNKALFIKEVGLGDIVSASSSVRAIKEDVYGDSFDNLDLNVTFTADMQKMKAHCLRSMAGIHATGIRPVYFYVDDDKKKELAEALLKLEIDGAVVTNPKATNYNINTNEVDKVFTLEGDIECSSLLERADNTIIFKVGALIGPQVEIYQEKPRQSPMEIEFPHYLDRKITITIPDGYEAKGLDALKFNIVGGEAASPTMGFVSNYTLTGNKLVIDLHEYYKVVNYPLSQYDQFRDVINASADFNKVSFVLEKK